MSARQQRFVQEYLIDLNATQAAIRAGYAPKSAAVEGVRLLRNAKVAAAVAKAQAKVATKAEITLESHLESLREIRDAALEAKQYAAATTAEVNRGKVAGLYVERVEHSGNVSHTLSDEEREKRVLGLVLEARKRKEQGMVS